MWIITLSRQEKAKLTVEVIQPRRYYKKDSPVQTAWNSEIMEMWDMGKQHGKTPALTYLFLLIISVKINFLVIQNKINYQLYIILPYFISFMDKLVP